MNKIFSSMKRILALLIVFGLVTGLVPVTAMEGIGALVASAAETAATQELDNGYIKVTVSEKTGGFGIRTVEGDKANKSDNDQYLVFEYDEDNTSFTSLQVTRNGKTKEYIFGGKYLENLGNSDVTVTKADDELIARWSVDSLTVTQTISLVNTGSTEHGSALINYEVENRGEPAEVKIRILMDTALGYQDYAIYKVEGEYLKTETTLGPDDYNKSFYAVTNVDDPRIVAYTINASVDEQECKPYQTILAHWNNLASTVFDYTPDETMNFTNFNNRKYLTSDSAYALYFDLGEVATGGTSQAATNYGVYSNEAVSDEATLAVNVNAPDVLQYAVNADGSQNQSAYENGGVFNVKTHIENITHEYYSKLRIVVTSAGCIDPLDAWGNPTNSSYDQPYSLEVVDVTAGEQLDFDWNFLAEPQESGQYSRILFKIYDVSDEATMGTGQIMQENLLGEGSSYIMCPGAVNKLPAVKFTGSSPETVFSSGIRNLYITGENFSMLLDKSTYSLRVSRLDGMAINGMDSFVIPTEQFQIDDSSNVISVILNEENPGDLPEGMYQFTLDYTDAAKTDLSGPALRFMVSNDEKFKNDSYGFLAVVKYEGLQYEIARFDDEEHYFSQLDLGVYQREDVLLEFQGNFLLEKTEDGSTRFKGISNNKSHNVMTLNGALDIRNGSCTVTEKDGSVKVDFDADLYTTGAGSYVHSGVAALTELEAGSDYSLIPYDEDGNREAMEGDTIALLWPSAGQAFQNLMGLLFNLKYGELGTISHSGAPNARGSETRVVAFGAAFDLSFLIPSSVDKQLILGRTSQTKSILGSSYDAAEHNSIQFSSDEIRALNKRASYRSDTANTSATADDVNNANFTDMSVDETPGFNSASITIDDILFGGEYLGIDMEVCLGLPPYIANLPALECLLSVDTIGDWEFGVNGQCHFASFKMEASIYIMSKDGVPIVDSMHFFMGGFTPGINIDGVGVLWLQGGGGGIENIYDTIFMTDIIPPLKLVVQVQFSVMQIFSAIASMGLSLRGVDITLTNGQFNEFADPESGITVVPQPITMDAGIQLDWYPEFYFQAYVDMVLAMCIKGGGYIVAFEDFYEFFLRAAVAIPSDVPIIGGYEVASMNLGANNSRVWGKVKWLEAVSIALVYYWGGDIEWNSGDSVHPTYPELLGMAANAAVMTVPVDYNEETGETMYMALGSNMTVSAASEGYAQTRATPQTDDQLESDVVHGRHHTMKLGCNGSGKILSIQWTCEDEAEARAAAETVTIVSNADSTKQIPIKIWSKDDAEGANANFSYDPETDTAYLSVVFAAEDEVVYNQVWEITTPDGSILVVYDVAPLPEVNVESHTLTDNVITLELGGYEIEKFTNMTIVAEGQTTGQSYLLGGAEDPFASGETTLTLTMPEQAMSDTYTLRIVCKDADATVFHEENVEITYVNPNQPKAPTAAAVENAGDYKLSVVPAAEGEFDGYHFTALDAEGNVVTGMEGVLLNLDGSEVYYDEDGFIPETEAGEAAQSYLIGGHYEQTVENDEGVEETLITGLSAGDYTIQVRTWKRVANGTAVLLSEPFTTDVVTVRTPVKTQIRGDVAPMTGSTMVDARAAGEENYHVKAVGSGDVVVQLTSDAESFTGTWRLDGGFAENERGEITAATKKASINFSGLEDGSHMLFFLGKNQYGDAVSVNYQFTVDTQGPRMLLGEPVNGSLFQYWTGELTISGVTDQDAVLTVTDNTDPDAPETVEVRNFSVDPYGNFTAVAMLDRSVLEHQLTITLTDRLGNSASRDVTVMSNGLGSIEKLLIYAGGSDVTNTKLTAGGTYLMSLMAKLKTPADAGEDAGDLIVRINNESLVDWVQEVVSGTSELKNQANGIRLATSGDAEGMVTARFLVSDEGSYPVSAAFGYTGEQIRSLNDIYTQIATTDQLYTGQPVTTEVQVWYDGTKLTEGVDYVIDGYTNNVNVTSGKEKAKVTVSGIGTYTGAVTGEFAISYLDTEDSMVSLSGVEGDNNFYVSDVAVIAADGYELVVDGETAQVLFTADGENSETFRIRRISDGAMTDLVTRSATIDKTAPTGTITLDETVWSKFLNALSFGAYKVSKLEAEVTAEDANGIAKLEFVVSETAYESITALSQADLTWRSYSNLLKPTIEQNKNQIIYVRAIDNAGNETYLSSEGIHADTVAPEASVRVVSVTSSTVHFEVTSNEIGKVWYAAQLASEPAPTVDQLKSGSGCIVSAELAGKPIALSVTGLKQDMTYLIYAVADDAVTVLSTGVPAPNTSEVVVSAPFDTVQKVMTASNTVIKVESGLYTGSEVTPNVTVTVDGIKLAANEDYTVTYHQNVEVSAKAPYVEVTGIGEYTGKLTQSFAIRYLELKEDAYTVSGTKGTDGCFTSDVTLIAKKGYVLIPVDGASLTFTENGVHEAKFQVRRESDKALTDVITLAIKVDKPDQVADCPKDETCILSQFSDIIVNDWYHDGIHFCVEQGIMNGMGEGKFAPNEPTTRAQLVTMLYRLEGQPSIAGMTEPFADVTESDWFYAPIVWAYNNKVVNGISETAFAPNANVTREQVATILYRYLGSPAGTGKLDAFPDVAKVSDYARDALIWAVGEKLINGVAQPDGTSNLDPAGNATRAQIATILMRHLTA